MTILTSDNLGFLVGLGGLLTLLLSAYNSIRRPQIKSEVGDGIMSQQIKDLASQLINLRDNHIHTMQVSLDANSTQIVDLRVTVTKLSTIIEERIPKNTNFGINEKGGV